MNVPHESLVAISSIDALARAAGDSEQSFYAPTHALPASPYSLDIVAIPDGADGILRTLGIKPGDISEDECRELGGEIDKIRTEAAAKSLAERPQPPLWQRVLMGTGGWIGVFLSVGGFARMAWQWISLNQTDKVVIPVIIVGAILLIFHNGPPKKISFG